MRLRYQFELIQLIRNFFTQQGFLDVLTPPAVENPGMEVHIHPFQLYSVNKTKLITYAIASLTHCCNALCRSILLGIFCQIGFSPLTSVRYSLTVVGTVRSFR